MFSAKVRNESFTDVVKNNLSFLYEYVSQVGYVRAVNAKAKIR